MTDHARAAGGGVPRARAGLLSAGVALLLSACATGGPPGGGRGERGPPPMRAFISPAGEPFRSGPPAPPGGPGPIERWRAQADVNGDGALQRDEMVKDFDRFFALIDVDKNGFVEGGEITRYEQKIAPEILGGGGPGGGPGGGGFGGGAAKLLNDLEPVMSADYDLNHRVAKAEFSRKAADAFRRLDVNGDGKLTPDELQPVRIAPVRPGRGGGPGGPPGGGRGGRGGGGGGGPPGGGMGGGGMGGGMGGMGGGF